MQRKNRRILLCDTTLRDGAQAPDIHFSFDERFSIASRLFDSGIDEIEAGIPAMGAETVAFIRELAEEYPGRSISAWCRANIQDIEAAGLTKTDIVHISVPSSPILLQSMDKNWNDIFESLPNLISRASDLFPRVSLGIPDVFRTPIDRIERLMLMADRNKLYRVRVADTVGTAMPGTVETLVRQLAGKYSTPLVFHGHNDLGLATANSLTAAMSGASWIDVTIGGIGERAGNTRLEEIAAAIKLSPSLETGFDLTTIQGLSALLSSITNRPIPANQPLTGRNILTHASGIHCRSVLRNELSFQPFTPSFIGMDSNAMVAGSHSGRGGIKGMLEAEGISVNADTLDCFAEHIRHESIRLKKSYSSDELVEEYIDFHRTASCS